MPRLRAVAGGTVGAMRLHVVDHPLVAHKLTVLRDRRTPSMIFRQLAEELVMLLAYEATRDVAVESVEVETPVATTTGTTLARPRPLIVPILRAGLGMLEGMTKMAPSAEVGFLGMARNEETLDIVTYAERLPTDLTGRHVFVLDPMLATGGTLIEAIRFLYERGAERESGERQDAGDHEQRVARQQEAHEQPGLDEDDRAHEQQRPHARARDQPLDVDEDLSWQVGHGRSFARWAVAVRERGLEPPRHEGTGT